jgi:hypothetical protein
VPSAHAERPSLARPLGDLRPDEQDRGSAAPRAHARSPARLRAGGRFLCLGPAEGFGERSVSHPYRDEQWPGRGVTPRGGAAPRALGVGSVRGRRRATMVYRTATP